MQIYAGGESALFVVYATGWGQEVTICWSAVRCLIISLERSCPP
jgi:hypothetical protein